MYIYPDTIIKILKNVPLDPTYDHTIYWDVEHPEQGKQAQASYFSSKAKYTFDNQTYQRLQRGWMYVGRKADDLYDCNYIMFQNHAYGNKWFYAFLKGVEYENDHTSRVEFEIDVMQTWFFDYNLDQCFVDREHSEHDTLFYNIVPENLELGGEYVSNALDEFDMNQMSVCALINRVTSQGTATAQTINNIFIPVHLLSNMTTLQPVTIEAILDQYQEDDIICVYQYPSFMDVDPLNPTPVVTEKIITPNLTTIDGYTPKNKKLFSHPYNMLLVSNNCGDTAEYRWEDWRNDNHRGYFDISGVFVSTPCVMCYPTQYRGIPVAFDDGISYTNFPQCPWSGDTFKAWWAQNKASFVTSAITSVISSVGGGVMSGIRATAFSGDPQIGVASAALGSVTNIASTVANCVAKVQDIKNTPSQTHGQVQTDSYNPGMGRVKFSFYSLSIKREFAMIIDEYFDRYGYATKRNKIPNRNVRPHWTFTKTIGCTITGSIPADDAKSICEIYNNGITFWANASEVGNYSYDNRVDVVEEEGATDETAT